VFSIYIPLLSSKRKHVRQFAAESFAYLIRQVPANKVEENITKIFEAAVIAITPKGEEKEKEVEEKGVEKKQAKAIIGRKVPMFIHGLEQLLFHSMKVPFPLLLLLLLLSFPSPSDPSF